ncbi:MAG: histidine phosphatase family protein [Acidobacteriota bacterium]
MRSLYILRHGKSDWNAAYGHDHDRPLAARGLRAAALVGHFFKGNGWPEALWSSSAVRALTTLERALKASGEELRPAVRSELYGAGVSDVLRLLGVDAEPAASVLIAGHEPTCSGLVQATTGARCRYPTAAIARIDFARPTWQDVAAAPRGELRWLMTPKALAHLQR